MLSLQELIVHDDCQIYCPDHVHHVQEAEDSSKQAEHITSQASKQPFNKAAAEAAPSVSKDTEMEDAELASKDFRDNKAGSKGTKRAAEDEAGAESSAASLTLAPSAKRQKTDADWGELVIQSLLAVLATRVFGPPCAVMQSSKVAVWLRSFDRERRPAVVS